MGRAPCCDKDKVKRGPWSPEEDAMLKAYINSYGTGNNWIALPQKIGLMRCGKSCRLRWLNYLRPNIKHGGFSEEEDNIISSLYISIGSRWSIIAAQLPGRTDNDIKNYWNTRLKKKLLGRCKTRLSASGDEDPKDTNDNNSLSNSALERLQLHMQLQNSFSLFSNPVMWSKLNPLQQKMIQTLQSFNDSTNLLSTPNIQHQGQEHNFEFNEPKVLDINVLDSTVVPNLDTSGAQTFTTFQAQADDFDCFREMEGSKDNMISWWSNEFESNSNSGSSSSWDSSNFVIDQSNHVMYQEFERGYEAH